MEVIAHSNKVKDNVSDYVQELSKKSYEDRKSYEAEVLRLRRKYKTNLSKVQVLEEYGRLLLSKTVQVNASFERWALRKSGRSSSGVLVITVLTAPGSFSCAFNCYYCPDPPGMPRSYIATEPAVARAYQNGFDAVRQFYDRAYALELCGHKVDKIELLVLGGTWSSYPHDYQETFVRDLFYSANTYYEVDKVPQKNRQKNSGWLASPDPRTRLCLKKEQDLNEKGNCRIIGLTLETRPDAINEEEITRLRYYGCTRLQLGIQHTDNTILKKINRGCTTERAIEALTALKNACYKIDIHLMLDLPYSSPEIDRKMIDRVLSDSDLSVDDWKIYPCMVVEYTEIKKWYDKGKYKPYAEIDGGATLKEIITETMLKVPPTIRLNRVIRDIPSTEIFGGTKDVNMRQYIEDDLKKAKKVCQCIRCREVKSDAIEDYHYYVRQFHAQGSKEYFISCEGYDHNKPMKGKEPNVLYGFVRVRLPKENQVIFNSLRGKALVRELHVYGHISSSVESRTETLVKHQSKGIGKQLMAYAESLAKARGYSGIAVISGVGVKGYYRHLGYGDSLDGQYMVKDFYSGWLWIVLVIWWALYWLLFKPKKL